MSATVGRVRERSSRTMDLTKGPLFKNMISFSIPIMITGIVQLMFNTADIVVIGRYGSDTALAAMSGTTVLINFVINLLIGLSVGAGVCVAKYFGAQDEKNQHEVVHTAMLLAMVGGVVFCAAGFFLARTVLEWMDTPPNVIDQAVTYVRIYFVGIPFGIMGNFATSILRSVGDTRRPLIAIVIAGVVNVLLNLFFVIVLNMDVAGVGWATAISTFISGMLVVLMLARENGCHRLDFRKLRIYKSKLKEILLVGLPSGIQSILFSVSAMLVQPSVNGFGDVVMTANGIGGNVEGYLYIVTSAFHQTAITFAAQHIGANKHERIKQITWLSLMLVSVILLVLGVGVFLLGRPLSYIYEPGRADVADVVVLRFSMTATMIFLCGFQEVLSGILRGMGKSISTMVIAVFCQCVFHVAWIYTVFAHFGTLTSLYIYGPIAWALTSLILGVRLVLAYRSTIKGKAIAEMQEGSDAFAE